MLVSTATLALHLHDSAWVIFDCRHDLADHAKGLNLYRTGHIPGAHFAPVETELSGLKRWSRRRSAVLESCVRSVTPEKLLARPVVVGCG